MFRLAPPLIALLSASTLSHPASGQPNQSQAFEQWWSEQVALTTEKSREGKLIVFSVQMGGSAREDVEALRREVAGKPDHPRRNDPLLASPTGERPRIQYRLWTGAGGARVRLSQDSPDRPDRPLDIAKRDGAAWVLNASLLNLRSLRSSDPASDFESLLDGYEMDASMALSAGLMALTERGIEIGRPPELATDGTWQGTWRATRSGGGEVVGHAVGTFADESGRVAHVGVKGLGSTGAVEWSSDFAVKMDTPRTIGGDFGPLIVLHDRAPGTPFRTLWLESVAPSTDVEIDRLTQTPSVDSPDPVRGPLTFSRIVDVRDPNVQRTQMKTVEGPWSEVETPRTPPKTPSNRLLLAGWCMLGGIVALLLILRFKRSTP